MPSLRSRCPNARMVFIRACTIHTVARWAPGRDGCGVRVYTIPVSLATSTAATRSWTRSCSWSSITCGLLTAATSWAWPIDTVSCPGARSAGTRPGILTGVLKATLRDPQVRPQRQANLGFVFHSAPALRAARPTVPPPAQRHKPQPGRGSSPSPPRPAPAQFHAARPSPMRWLSWPNSGPGDVQQRTPASRPGRAMDRRRPGVTHQPRITIASSARSQCVMDSRQDTPGSAAPMPAA